MTKKKIAIKYFKATTENLPNGQSLYGELADLHVEDESITLRERQHTIELYDVKKKPDRFEGYIRKHRRDNLPSIGKIGEEDKELNLTADEGVIERSRFIVYKEHEIVLIHQNRYAGGDTVLSRTYTNQLNKTITLYPVLLKGSLQRLFNHKGQIKNIYFRIAAPSHDAIKDDPDDMFTNDLMKLLDDGGNTVGISVSGDYKLSEGTSRRSINPSILQKIKKTLCSPNLVSAKIELDENGKIYPIDLVADRMIDHVEVCNENEIFNRMNECYTERKEELGQLFSQ